MAQDLSIREAFGEIRSLKQRLSDEWGELILTDPYPSFTREAARLFVSEVMGFFQRAQVDFGYLIDSAQGSPEEVISVLSPYVLEYLDQLQDHCFEKMSPYQP